MLDVEKSVSPLLRYFMKREMATLREQHPEKPRGCPADATCCSQTQERWGPKLLRSSKHRENWKMLLQGDQQVQAVGEKCLAPETGPAQPPSTPSPVFTFSCIHYRSVYRQLLNKVCFVWMYLSYYEQAISCNLSQLLLFSLKHWCSK